MHGAEPYGGASRLLPLLFGALVLAGAPDPAGAQQGWIFQQRGGVALATRDVEDADLGIGYGFEGSAGYQVTRGVGLYAGWTWFHFGTEESFAGPNVEVDESGFLMGIRYERSLPFDTPATLQVHLGLVHNSVELEEEDGSIIVTSDRGIGWAASTGAEFPLADNWRFGPSLRYRSLSPEFTFEGEIVETDLDHLSLDLGFSRHF